MRIEEFIDQSNLASSVDELFGLFERAMGDLGFDRIIFSLMTDHIFINRRAGHGIMLNYTEDWMKFYAEKNYVDTDPVRRNMYHATGAFTWHDVLQRPDLTKTQIECMILAEEAKMHDGVGIPLRGPRGAIAGVGAASSSGGVELNRNSLSYINLLAHQFYTAYLALEQKPDNRDTVYLSDREQEILKWCARGKTKPEISDIIHISPHTVDYHIRSAMKKLEANNITLAVLKALHMGLIQL